MLSSRNILEFVAKSTVVGLAAAFVVVLLKPDWVAPSVSGPVSSYAEAVTASSPAVVSIFTEVRPNGFVDNSAVPLRGGLGSGVIVDSDGYLVTNWHVVNGAQQIRVQLADGRIAVPEIVGTDRETELALLRIDLPDLPNIKLGRSDLLQVGDVVIAIGNSLGLSQTVTMGIVSAQGRGQLGVATFESFIQTDAAINIGNSGGALVNARGELVGINTAVLSSIRSQRAAPAGIAFAIPVNLMRGVMDQLIRHGRVIRGFLGVDPENLSTREAESLGLNGATVLLRSVWGPAAEAGLAAGDVLTHINGERIINRQHAMNVVAGAQPGDRMRIRVARVGGLAFETEAILEERRVTE